MGRRSCILYTNISSCIVGWEKEDPPELNSAVSHPLWLLPAKVFTKLDAIDLEFNQNFSKKNMQKFSKAV